jgi:1,4-alpha-glucan branching enzyme/maltooligosyltrehalose trehalohydrolase
LAVRREAIVPRIPCISGNAGAFKRVEDGAIVVQWRVNGGETLTLAANLSNVPVQGFPAACGAILFQEGSAGEDGAFGPWAVRWSLASEGGS